MIAFLDTLGGIASHPLLVHIPVVLVPLATIGAVAIAIRPSLMKHYGPLVAGLAFIGFLGSVLAASSGEALEEQYEEAGQSITGTLADHVELGDRVKLFVLLFLAVMVAWVVLSRRLRQAAAAPDPASGSSSGRQRHIVTVLMALALLTGGVASWAVAATGHSGATSVWEQPEP